MAFGSSKPRSTVATLVLAGVLLVMIGVAWALVRYYRTSAREGALLLAEMRRQTLAGLWPRQHREARYEWRDASGRLEGRLQVSRRAVEGGFEGVTIHVPVAGPALRQGLVKETWTVSDDLAKGDYRADYLTLRYAVEIRLEGGQIHFRTTGMEEEAQEEAPANYVPEGLEWLAVRMVARAGKKATFAMVSNNESRAARDIVPWRVTMTPLDARTVRCLYEWRAGSFAETFHLDDSGEVARVAMDDGAVLAPAGPEPEPQGTQAGEDPGAVVGKLITEN